MALLAAVALSGCVGLTGASEGAPSIVTQPASQTVAKDRSVTLSVEAAGEEPISYQWMRGEEAIEGATEAEYTTPTLHMEDSGVEYTVVVTNPIGSVTGDPAVITVAESDVAPSITAHPADASVNVGQSATFSVAATGTAPLAYQWFKNGVQIPGGVSSSYTTPPTTASDNGSQFTVVVSNPAGSATSNAARLTVNADPAEAPLQAPAIVSQPVSRVVTAGQRATFSVTASGSTPMSYQWRKNGANISGATSSSYTTPPTTTADSGAQFSVVVSNSAGSATSSSATLTVNTAGRLSLNPSSLSFGAVNIGESSSLSATLSNTGGSPVTLSNVSLSGPGFSVSGLSTGTVLNPGQSTSFSVRFAPSSTSSVTGSVTITSNASNSPVTLALSGTGAAVVSHSVLLSWSPITSATGYHVYRGAVSGGPYTKLTASPSALASFTDETVQSGRTYYYVVTSIANNVESAYSNQASATIP